MIDMILSGLCCCGDLLIKLLFILSSQKPFYKIEYFQNEIISFPSEFSIYFQTVSKTIMVLSYKMICKYQQVFWTYLI